MTTAGVVRLEGGRLVYYRERAPNPSTWSQHWEGLDARTVYDAAAGGALGTFEDAFTRFLPKPGRILEAGCGLGNYVLALRARGYDAEGVEYAPGVVARARAAYPDLPIRVADVTALDVPDGHYAAYISLGVIEHRREGADPFLAEAHRVIFPGGIAIITVPWFNPLRRWKARHGAYRAPSNGLAFYQYAYEEREFRDILSSHGFKVLELQGYAAGKGLKDELPLLPSLYRQPRLGWPLRALLSVAEGRSRWLRDRTSHMLLAVAQRA